MCILSGETPDVLSHLLPKFMPSHWKIRSLRESIKHKRKMCHCRLLSECLWSAQIPMLSLINTVTGNGAFGCDKNINEISALIKQTPEAALSFSSTMWGHCRRYWSFMHKAGLCQMPNLPKSLISHFPAYNVYCSTGFLGTLVGNWIGNKTSMTETSANMECQHHRQQLSPLYNNKSPRC